MYGEWRTSSYCKYDTCVEVDYAAEVRVRDSKNPDGGILVLPPSAWSELITAAR
ncbi:MAG TPA: DUF397 domain-containing protein [Actinokineospora sp.]|jgi:hypothetical protein|nr:DUF397 domain-containing protein [Actinokineospora sp.]